MDDSSSKRDLYTDAVRDSESQSRRPEFLGGENDGWDDNTAYRLNGDYYDKSGRKIRKKNKKKTEAVGSLSSAERNAAQGAEGQSENGLYSARQKESSVKGFYAGAGGKLSGVKKKNIKGVAKKSAPILMILGALVGVIVAISSSQNLLPIAVKEMVVEKFNSVGTSSTMASDDWLDTQLNQGVRTGNIKTGDTETQFAFSSYQVQQFEKHGIEVVGDGEDDEITALIYEKDGQYIPVVGSNAFDEYSNSTIISKVQSASGLNNIGYPVTAEDALADSDFKIPYTKASKAWRGGTSGWFDNIMSDITEVKLNITRNRWSKYIAKSLKTISEEFKSTAKNQNNVKDKGVSAENEYEDTDEDGEKVTKTQETDSVEIIDDGDDVNADSPNNTSDSPSTGEEPVKTTDTSVDGVDTEEGIKNVFESKAVKAASTGATVGCAVLKGLISIYDIVSAEQKLQFLNLASGFLEAVDKVKAGDGSGSPIHEYSTNLVTKADTIDENGEPVENRSGKTAMESAGMSWLFGKNNTISQSDPSVRNVNFESIMTNLSSLTSTIALTSDVYAACGYAKIGVAVVDLASTILSVVTAGSAKAVWEGIIKPSAKAVIKGAAYITIMTIIPIAAKNYAKMLLNDVATEWFGEDLGNAYSSAFNMYGGGNGTSGGQGGGTLDKVLSYFNERDSVIAEEAKYQRAVRSPFDVTSPYTFLGSLMYAAIPMAYSSGMMASMTSASSMVNSAMVAMLPSANAIGSENIAASTGDCSLLGSTGAVGDAFCNPYIITDTTTMSTSPVAVSNIVHNIDDDAIAADDVYAKVGSDNFDDNGRIKDGSNLAKYVIYCGQRTSQYGLYDASITAQITGEDSTTSKIIGFVPVLSDIQDIGEGAKEELNQRYITGEACVASDDDYWMNENRWYQRYAENERLLENMNPGYTSTVTAYLREYYMENPLDQSYEGTLARFTGMSKDEVEDTLALIDYYNFINDYHPEDRYAFGAPAVEVERELRFENENNVADNSWVILLNQIGYADVRNRSFAA